MKCCTACKVCKNLDDFYKDVQKSDGKYSICKSCAKLKANRYRLKNLDKVRVRKKEYSMRPDVREKERRRLNSRRKTVRGKLEHSISNGILKALKRNKKGFAWQTLLDYSAEELKMHIEKLFTDNMTWERFLKGDIHIDHKIPKSWFKYETSDDIEFKKCWSLNNLQPKWKEDNLKKGAKYAD